MKELTRLAGWGMAAAAALALAVTTAYSPGGQDRLLTSITGHKIGPAPVQTTPPPALTVTDPVQDARLTATETETRRLSETLRTLDSERERLLARIASLERALEDITGSIKQQSARAVLPTFPTPAAPGPAEPPIVGAAPPQASPAEAVPPPMQPPEPRAANIHPAPSVEEPTEPQSAFGVDVGGAASFEGLRALWNTTRKTYAPLLDGLQPIVTVRENPRTRTAELRLIVGPLPDSETAAQLCATFSVAKRYCRPETFEGPELSLSAPEPPRRPAAQTRKAPPRSAVRTQP
jgi:hypothetical protein